MNLNSRGAVHSTPRVLVMLALAVVCGAGFIRLDAAAVRNETKSRVQRRLPSQSTSIKRVKTASAYGRLPLIFESNQGQSDPQVKFLARGSGYGLYLTQDQAVLAVNNPENRISVVRMALNGANAGAAVSAQDELPGKSNYFIGNDPSKWHRNIAQFGRVRYRDVYPGIDLVYYGNQGKLEYDFEVAPGADPKQIAIEFRDGEKLHLAASGDLDVLTNAGKLQLQAPRIYQRINDEDRSVDGWFVLQADNQVAFRIGDYDRAQPLVIDPVLTYSTYLGGSGDESCSVIEQTQLGFSNAQFTPGCPAIAVDAAFRTYIAGATTSPNFPTIVPGTASVSYQACLDTPPPNPATCTTGLTNSDVFITRLNSSGSALDFATYLGGTGTDVPTGIAVDQNFNVHVAGITNSANFPTQVTAFQPTAASAGTHAFVSEIAAGGGSLLYSTYLSGTGLDIATGIAVDNLGKEYVSGTTTSPAFPTTGTALQTTPKATNQFFFTKLDPTVTGPTGLLYSTYIGGSNPGTGVALGGGVAVDTSCNVYLTGGTNFVDMPVLNANQGTNVGGFDAWVAKFSGPTGSACGSQYSLTYMTYFGGSGDDIAYGIAVDTSLNAYITGSTTSPNIAPPTGFSGVNFAKCLDTPPSTTIAYPSPCPSNGTAADAFIAKFGSLTTTVTTGTNVPYLYFTYLGGTLDDTGTAIAVNSIGGAVVTGWTKSTDFPAATVLSGLPVQAASGGGEDAFVTRIDTTTVCTPVPASGSTAAVSCPGYSSYLGGSGTDIGTSVAVDSQDSTYVTGETSSPNFPLAAPFQATRNGSTDAFVSKLGPQPSFVLTVTAPLSTTTFGVGNSVAFTYNLINNGDPASNVVVIDSLPATEATFNSISVGQGSCGAPQTSTVTCNIGSLNSGGSTTITVNLTPTAPTTPSSIVTGLSNSVAVSAAGAQTITASATASIHDFNIQVEPGTPASVTEPAGVPANFTVQVSAALGNFPNSISLSATLPSSLTATTTTWTTNPIPTLTGGSQTSVLTVTTTSRVTTTTYLLHRGGQLFAISLPISGVAFLGLGLGGKMSRRRRIVLGLALATFFTLMFLQAGCGSSSSTTTTTGTPAGTYIITLNATSGTATRTTTVTLVVQ